MKFLDAIETPPNATHVTIHLDNAGKQGPTLRYIEEGKPYEYFLAKNLTRDWVARTFGDGEFRFNFYTFDGESKTRIGPRGGSVSCRKDPPAGVAPAGAPLPSASGPGGTLTVMDAIALVTTIHTNANASAMAAANQQIQREREFLLQGQAQQQSFMKYVLEASKPPTVDVANAVREAVAEEMAELSTAPAAGEPLNWWQQMLLDTAKKTGDSIVKAADAMTEEKLATARGGAKPALASSDGDTGRAFGVRRFGRERAPLLGFDCGASWLP